MELHANGELHNKYNTSFKYTINIDSAEDLQKVLSLTDITTTCFKDGFTNKGKEVKCHRSLRDFRYSEALFADFDNDGMNIEFQYTIQDFQDEFSEYEYYLSTSESHRIEKHGNPALDRFHVFFPIERIVNKDLLIAYLETLDTLFQFAGTMDRACIDAARLTKGSKNNITMYNPGKDISLTLHEKWNGKVRNKLYKKIEGRGAEEIMVKKKKTYRPVNNYSKTILLIKLGKAIEEGIISGYNGFLDLMFAMKHSGFQLEDFYSLLDDDIAEKIGVESKWEGAGDGSLTEGSLNYWTKDIVLEHGDFCKKG